MFLEVFVQEMHISERQIDGWRWPTIHNHLQPSLQTANYCLQDGAQPFTRFPYVSFPCSIPHTQIRERITSRRSAEHSAAQSTFVGSGHLLGPVSPLAALPSLTDNATHSGCTPAIILQFTIPPQLVHPLTCRVALFLIVTRSLRTDRHNPPF